MLGVRLGQDELLALRELLSLRSMESAGHLIRVLLKEDLCRRKGQSENIETVIEPEGIVKAADAGIR